MFRYVKRLGQVFLINKEIRKKIAKYIDSLNFSSLVEIGPGEGAITSYLDLKNKKIILIELDSRLIPHLKNKFPETLVINDDFLVFSFQDCCENTLLFGNIPYNITSKIILKFFRDTCFSESVFMVQKECFEVISAPFGSKKYSSFSVLIQSLSSSTKVLYVDRKNFYPIPGVDSVVFHMKKLVREKLDIDKYSIFLRKSFSMPRKTLWNNLKKWLSKPHLKTIFESNNLHRNVRPSQIPPDLYLSIFLKSITQEIRHDIV